VSLVVTGADDGWFGADTLVCGVLKRFVAGSGEAALKGSRGGCGLLAGTVDGNARGIDSCRSE